MPSLSIPNTFVAGTVAQSAQVNANFTAIATLLNSTLLASDNIQTGGIATANLATGSVSYVKLASSAIMKQSYEIRNLGLSSSVATNAWTVALKQADGTTDPSTNEGTVAIGFRSATATNGLFSTISITGAAAGTTITVPSGTTIGTISGAKHWIYVYVLNNAGTAEIALSLSRFDDGSIQSSSAISGGASAAALYSTTARSNVPIRLVGRILISEATAGTWASEELEISNSPFVDTFAPVSYTPTLTNFGSPNSDLAFRYIVANGIMEIWGYFRAQNSVSGNECKLTIPTAYKISSLLPFGSNIGSTSISGTASDDGGFIYFQSGDLTHLFFSRNITTTSATVPYDGLNGQEVVGADRWVNLHCRFPVELA